MRSRSRKRGSPSPGRRARTGARSCQPEERLVGLGRPGLGAGRAEQDAPPVDRALRRRRARRGARLPAQGRSRSLPPREASTFLLLSAAVLAAAAYGGLGPGVFATLLGGVAGDYLFLPPVGTLVPPSAEHGLTTALFVAQGLAISVLGAWPRQGAGPKRARCGPRKIVGAWARARNASGCWWRAPRTTPSS